MRMRKKKNLTGRMAACEDVQVLNPEELRGKWREHFECEPDTVLNVEIGCGKGGFIVQMAKQNPDQLFVAVERVESVLLVAMERHRRKNWTTCCSSPMTPPAWTWCSTRMRPTASI